MASAGGIRAGRAFVEIGVNDAQLVAGLRRAQARLRSFGASLRTQGSQIARVGAAAAGGFGVASAVFARFDDRMRAVGAISGATGEEFKKLTDAAKRLGRTTSFSASQVADAMTELARGGFEPTAILSSIDAVLALARATGTDLPLAAQIAGSALRGFGLEADQTARVADVLTATANGSAQRVEDIGEAIKFVAPIASAAGESIEDVSALLGVLANNGIRGSLAGNAVARAFKNLSKTSKQSELRSLGVEAVDASGDLRPLIDIVSDLGAATAGLSSTQRLAVFESLFGRGQASLLKLASLGDAIAELAAKIRDSGGVAARTAEAMDAGIGGAFRRVVSAAEGVAIAVGESIAGPVSVGADAVARLAGRVSAFVARNPDFVRGLLLLSVSAVALGAGLIVAGAAFGVAAFAVGVLGSALSVLLSPLALVLAAFGVVSAAVLSFSGGGAAAVGVVTDAVGSLGGTLAGVTADVGKLKSTWSGVVDSLTLTWIQFTSTVESAFESAVNSVAKASTLLNPFLSPADIGEIQRRLDSQSAARQREIDARSRDFINKRGSAAGAGGDAADGGAGTDPAASIAERVRAAIDAFSGGVSAATRSARVTFSAEQARAFRAPESSAALAAARSTAASAASIAKDTGALARRAEQSDGLVFAP